MKLCFTMAFGLFFLAACSSDPQPDNPQSSDPQIQTKTLEELLADSAAAAAKAPPADTTGFVGAWKGTYSEYAYTYKVDLVIRKKDAPSCKGYSCEWTRRDQFGSQRKTYSWCAAYSDYKLTATTNFGRDNTFIAITNPDPGSGVLYLFATFPGSGEPWQIQLTH